jgi:DNA-binding LacI/PurR family transcriptional regulator
LGDVSEHSPEFALRYKGYCRALEKAGLVLDSRLQINAETSEEEGYKATLALLQKRIPFDAVFGASDLIAIGAIKALEEAGMLVPSDVAVMGFDDIPMASYTHPPLSTVQQNTALAGELLVESLLKKVKGEPVESLLLPAKLIVRGSCGAQKVKK